MTRISAPAVTAFLSLLLIAPALPAQASDTASSTVGVSKVRIVRLSEIKGEVTFDVNGGQGLERAMPNLPIVEQTRLQTGDGVAEVEFEDNSTLRLAPNTQVEFPRLELLASGAKASTVHVVSGTVYVSMVNTKGNDFTLLFGQQKIQLPPSSHIRLQMEPKGAKLAVLDGSIQVDGPAGTIEVPKKKTVTFPLAEGQPEVAKNVATEPFDSWDHDSAGYHKQFAASNALSTTPYSYGVSDLLYYGNFANTGGCGNMWYPYFTSATWSPYSNGAWAYYPGAGYSWVSPYPWAWTPYHSGSWAYCNGAGWGWQPGSTWNGLNNVAATSPTLGGIVPRSPVRAPLRGEGSLVLVNLKPLTFSTVGAEDKFVFRKDSAGLGVPRGSLGNLEKLSQHTIEHGMATTHVYAEVPETNRDPAATSGFAAGLGAASIHRGYAAPAPASQSSRFSGMPATAGSGMATSASSSSTGHASSSSGGHPR
jgi:hypothetical protein